MAATDGEPIPTRSICPTAAVPGLRTPRGVAEDKTEQGVTKTAREGNWGCAYGDASYRNEANVVKRLMDLGIY